MNQNGHRFSGMAGPGMTGAWAGATTVNRIAVEDGDVGNWFRFHDRLGSYRSLSNVLRMTSGSGKSSVKVADDGTFSKFASTILRRFPRFGGMNVACLNGSQLLP